MLQECTSIALKSHLTFQMPFEMFNHNHKLDQNYIDEDCLYFPTQSSTHLCIKYTIYVYLIRITNNAYFHGLP